MVKQIVRDIFFLSQPSEPATKADIQVGKDLQDTLQANREQCVGMAANMIGKDIAVTSVYVEEAEEIQKEVSVLCDVSYANGYRTAAYAFYPLSASPAAFSYG